MPSLLHMPHRALKLNVYAAPSPATDRVVRLVFLEGRSLSNPVEARCCIAPKDCMQKEDVLAYVLPKQLLHSLDVPYARLFFFAFSFGSGQKKRSCDSKLAWW